MGDLLPQEQNSDQHPSAVDSDVTLLKGAVAAYRAGNKERSRKLLAEAAAIAPDNELVWIWTASAARTRSEALEALERVLKINPNHQKARQWRARLVPKTPPVDSAKRQGPPKTADKAESRPALVSKQASTDQPTSSRGAPHPVAEPKTAAPVAPAKAPSQPLEDSESVENLWRSTEQPQAPVRAPTPKPSPPPETKVEPPVDGSATPAEPFAEPAKTAPPTERETPPPAGFPGRRFPQGSSRPISLETCALCGRHSIKHGECTYCRAIVDIERLDDISRNEKVDRTVAHTAVQRFQAELEKAPSLEANLGLALAYLNLRQSQDALPRLAEACRLEPRNELLRRQLELLRERKLILAADDSKTVQKMIAGILEKRLYRVSLATDGLQALARLDEELPAAILLDIAMPRMDGYQVCKVITNNTVTAKIPVVILSSNDGFLERVRCKMAGAADYVAKPFDPEELVDTIERRLAG